MSEAAEIARKALSRGDLIGAYDATVAAIEAGDPSGAIRHQQILALARMGDTDRAMAKFADYGLQGSSNVDERTIVPRSFIGELLDSHFGGGDDDATSLIGDPPEVDSVLDLCTGSGCLAILAARHFPNAAIHAVDISKDALAVAARNVADHGLEDRIALHRGDLFAPLSGQRYDLIISNPPYVDAEGMAALPRECRAEPKLAFDGGPDGLDIVRRILDEAKRHLTPGGGLLCEPMARLGALVVGADASANNIEVAKLHAAEGGLSIDYRATTAETLAEQGETFDVILNMEVVEHVADVGLFLGKCAEMVKPGGIMFVATINRTLKALGLAIIGAEYVLRWLPRGTHKYGRLVRPEELETALSAAGLTIIDRTGVVYNPLADRWHRSKDMDVNYMVLAERAVTHAANPQGVAAAAGT